MGSKQYALRAASPRRAYRPPGVWPPAGRNWCFLVTYLNQVKICQDMLLKITNHALWAAGPQVADRPARGWPPKGHIIMTP
jgi:hypothetical protein